MFTESTFWEAMELIKDSVEKLSVNKMKLKIRKWISEKRWYILAFAIPLWLC